MSSSETNLTLAARCREAADKEQSGTLARKAALCAGICFHTTKTISGARKVLAEIKHGPVRAAATEFFERLVSP